MATDKKLNIQSFAELFATASHLSKRKAEDFLRTMFEVIEQALKKDGFVKIKGFGTFKLVEISARESINVNTGERIRITGHTRVTFTPDTNLRDLVNRPFSDFTTTPLAENLDIEDLERVTNEVFLSPEEEQEVELKDSANDELHQDLDIELAISNSTKKESSQQEERKNTNENVFPPLSIIPPIFYPETLEEITQEECKYKGVVLPIPSSSKISMETQQVEETVSRRNYTPTILFRSWQRIIAFSLSFIFFGAIAYYIGFSLGKRNKVEERSSHTTIQSPPTSSSVRKKSSLTNINSPLLQNQEKKELPKQNQPRNSSLLLNPQKKYRITGTLSTHTLQAGETLSKLSKRTYGSQQFYRYIIQYNNFDNPDHVEIGTQIKLPALEEVEKDL